VIETKLLAVRRDRADVLPTTLKLEAGRHALLGRKEDGVLALLACMAGDVRPRRGSISVLGGAPSSPSVRARVGSIPLGLRLPDVLRVDETIALARRIRKDAPVSAASVLEPFGLGALATHLGSTLDAGQTRAVALAEALASPSVSVILIEEPFVAMAPPAAAALPAQLAAKKKACVVVATASAFDASRVAEDFAIFDRGRLVRIVTEAPLRAERERPRVRVVASDVRALAAALAKQPATLHLDFDARSVVVDGDDPTALAAAVNAAIVESQTQVQSIEPEPASLEDLQREVAAPTKGAA
jgi:ABC-type multidrug transport system ATPase subunit